MRNIINISLPADLANSVRKEVRRGKFASTSEYFRYILRTQELAQELERRDKKFDKGKGKILHSLADLD